MRERRGFTLIETVLSMAMMLIVTGAIYQLLFATQRLARAQTDRLALQSNVRSAALIVINELRELSTMQGGNRDQNDLLAAGPTDLTYRAMRGVGFLCQASSGSELRIARNGFTGQRDPQAGRDSAYVFVEGQSDTDTDDAWVAAGIIGVSTGSACPGGIGTGITLSLATTPSVLVTGTPVRISEIMQLRLYQSEGKSWLGARSVSSGEAIQPVLGPLADGNGLLLEYFDAFGNPTTDVTRIRRVGVSVRGVGQEPSPVEEELTTQLALHNAFEQ